MTKEDKIIIDKYAERLADRIREEMYALYETAEANTKRDIFDQAEAILGLRKESNDNNN